MRVLVRRGLSRVLLTGVVNYVRAVTCFVFRILLSLTLRVKKEELKKKNDAFQKSVDELDRYEQMKELFKTAEQFGKEMEAMDDKKAFREHTQKIIQMVEEMDNTSAAINEIRQTGLHPSISSGLQAPGTFAPNKTLFQ